MSLKSILLKKFLLSVLTFSERSWDQLFILPLSLLFFVFIPFLPFFFSFLPFTHSPTYRYEVWGLPSNFPRAQPSRIYAASDKKCTVSDTICTKIVWRSSYLPNYLWYILRLKLCTFCHLHSSTFVFLLLS